jgi:hypothetical protein
MVGTVALLVMVAVAAVGPEKLVLLAAQTVATGVTVLAPRLLALRLFAVAEAVVVTIVRLLLAALVAEATVARPQRERLKQEP